MPRRATPNSRNTPHLSPPATRLATGVDALVDADPAHAPAASASSRSLSSLRMPSDMGPSTLGADPVPVDAAHWGAPMSRKPTIVLGIVVMLTVAALRPILNARGKAVCLVRCTGRAHVGRRSWLGCRCLYSLRSRVDLWRSPIQPGNAVPFRGSDRGTRRCRSDRATTPLDGAVRISRRRGRVGRGAALPVRRRGSLRTVPQHVRADLVFEEDAVRLG